MAKERYLEQIWDNLSEEVANVFIEKEISIPSSKTELFAFLLHKVVFGLETPERIDATQTAMGLVLSKTGKTTVNERATTIAFSQQFLSLGDAQGSLTEYQIVEERGARIWDFDPPILIAQDHLHFGMKGLNNTAVQDGGIILYYTLEKVSREAFIAALVD